MKQACLFLFGFFGLSSLLAQVQEKNLNQNWQFKQATQVTWYPAQVPGNVFVDLYQNQQIPDPFYANNETALQWVELADWEYKNTITADSAWFNFKNEELVFEGLDTYAKVFLNDSLILQTNNMFRTFTINVKGLLKLGNNELRIAFASAIKKGKEEEKKLTYALPEGERVFTRKAQFQYGWDFGPRFAGCGIWKAVTLRGWNKLKITSWHTRLNTLNDSLAKVELIVETLSDNERTVNYNLKYTNLDPKNKTKIGISKKSLLHKGLNVDTILISIKNPQRWWCNGLGAATLYYFNLTINEGSTALAEKVLPIGLRKIELIQNADSVGHSFYFKLNELPVFMKGANVIPSDIFLREKSADQLNEQIKRYAGTHMNMLRVWGGGVYADDKFMEACDKNGILIWQDFSFAGAMYPGDEQFLNNVKEELKDQITRLRNHPSLALWCGNNEIDEAWHNWGWQKQFNYLKIDSVKIWSNYKKLFHERIPKTVNELNPQTSYWPSSPAIGWGHAESLKSGDSHYWGIWWGMQPFKTYEQKVGRFMSEYGFQSLPALATFKTFTPMDSLNLNSLAVKAHQKHKTGFETIQHYLQQAYKTPETFQDYIYVSQLLQRDGMKTAIEAHRKNKPLCMGTLFWQLNDCWPGISWSAEDYDGAQKAMFYELKRLYKTHLVVVTNTSNQIQLTVITDSLNAFNATLQLSLKNFNSEVIWKNTQLVKLNANTNTHIRIDKKDLPWFDTNAVYLKAELKVDTTLLANTYFYFTAAKNLKLLKPTLNLLKHSNQVYEISSDVLVKDVYLYNEQKNVNLSDNFFDLEKGQVKKIKIEDTSNKQLRLQLNVRCLNANK